MKELWTNLIEAFTNLGVSKSLATIYLIVAMLLIVMTIVAFIMRIIVVIKYADGNRTKTQFGKTSFEVAREALDKVGLNHIRVKKASFIRTLFFGNSYSLSKKTIFLRRNIADKDSITAVGIALQKVGIAKMCENGNGMTKTRNVMQILNIFAPTLFAPVVLIGFLLDIIILKTVGAFSVVGIVIGMFLVLTGLIATILSLPVEKKANAMALKIIEENDILNSDEQRIIKKVFDAYIIAYVCDFIIAILRVIQLILEIMIKSQANNSK